MGRSFASHVALVSLVLGAASPQAALAAPRGAETQPNPSGAAAAKASLTDLVNEDGTLRLDGSRSGSLDLAGWTVTLDDQRGPLFSRPQDRKPALSSTVTPGSWNSLGGGGGPTNREVAAMAIMGGNLYVGGWFTDFDNIPEADYIAMWDGATWSALGNNGNGDGSLQSGGVTALAVDGSTLYAGGWFCGVNNLGMQDNRACRIAKWNGTAWSNLGSNGAGGGSLSLWVNALAVDASGNVYAGGAFTNPKNNDGNTVTAADYVAKWNPATDTWSALGSNDGAGTNGSLASEVRAIAVYGTNVYVGGSFQDVNHNGSTLTAADFIARWDTGSASWSALGNNGGPMNGSLNSWVSAIAVDSTGNVYAGGIFQNATNSDGLAVTAADYIAMWNGSAWSALGNNGAGTPNGSIQGWVFDIEVDSADDVYAAGFFSNVMNSDASTLTAGDYVAKWDHSSGLWSSFGGDAGGDGSLANSSLYVLAVNGSDVYVGGDFHGVENGSSLLAHAINLAHWDGSDWLAMTSAQGALNAHVYAVAVSGSNVYVGGNFTNLSDNGTPIPEADFIARWDGAQWHALGSGSPGQPAVPSTVWAIAVDGNKVYAGGSFASVDNGFTYLPAACRVAMWDGANWSALGSACPMNSSVVALAVDGAHNLYAGGNFTDVNNSGTPILEADYVAKWDGSNWSALGSNGSSNGSLAGSVTALATLGTDVYVGGNFLDVEDATNGVLGEADYVAKWNGSQWSALGNCGAGFGSLNGPVEALAVSGTNVYVGGWFLDACNSGGSVNEADFIALFNGSTWSALGDNGSTNGSLNQVVMSIAVAGSIVYAGGDFTDVDNHGTMLDEADFVARFDGTNWEALGSDGAGGGSINSPAPGSSPGNPGVEAVAVQAENVYVGGYFFDVNNNGTPVTFADHIARFEVIQYSISGNAGVAGATISYAGGPTVADGAGDYSFSVPSGWSGTVTPSKTDYVFTPTDRVYSNVTGDQLDQDYAAFELSPTIAQVYPAAGAVNVCLKPQVGVALILSPLVRLPAGAFDPSTVTLKLDNVDRTGQASILQSATNPASHITIVYTPTSNLSTGSHMGAFTYPSAGGPVTYDWSFTVSNSVCPTSAPAMAPPGTTPGSEALSIEASAAIADAASRKVGEAALQPRQRREQ